MCVGFAQTQLQVQRAVTTVGRLPKMAAHVVLVQNQPERAAAMHGKTIFSFAFLISVSISQAANSQNLFDEKVKCQKLGENILDDEIQLKGLSLNLRTNFDRKNQNCYVLIEKLPSDLTQIKKWQFNFLYDGVTKETIAISSYERDENFIEKRNGWYIDDELNIKKNGFDAAQKYIDYKMKVQR